MRSSLAAFFSARNHRALRTFLTATWLGWRQEASWASAPVFALYLILRPLSSVLILVVMYSVITDGALEQPIFAYIYLGNALYILVGQLVGGISMAVVEDREHYQMMKQIHTAPINGYAYMLGRGIAKLLLGVISALVITGVGMLFFPLPLHPAAFDWPLLITSMAVGLTGIAALGVIIGALNMVIPRHIGSIGDAVAAALFLFTGAIFPLDVLPTWMQSIGFALPITYWLEASRRALLGPDAARFPTLAHFDDLALLQVLALGALGFVVVSIVVYRWAVYRAKANDLIDMDTSY
ncbi:MAG: ABC transporter permease [Chloroflexota bacterium]|nr:MAG: hypothetical protein DIU68_10990 [Chloroflexota bacterium]